ncbi:restriction endonuclease subunit S [Microbulbifer sp. JMSA002]|uniref:restriction endonuclease subunit S n=1 Tax=Microbulbifer sp. JMSA002 TaxID=3243368 RepID=UPI0040395921
MTHKTVAGNLPDKWVGALIKNVCRVVRGSSPRPAGSPLYFDGDFLPWATVADITSSAEMYLKSTKSMLTKAGAERTRITDPGTLMLTNSGATLGVPKISSIKCGANDGIAMLLELDGIATEYAYYYLLSKTQYFRDVVAPGVGQPNLNTDLIGDFPIPIPPLPEQKKIAQILSTWDKAIDTTEKLLASSRQQKKALMQQLLTGKKRLKSNTISFKKTRYGEIPEDWNYPAIKDIAIQLSEKNNKNHNYPVLSCSKHTGFVDSLKYFKKKVYSDDTSGYRIIPRNCFGFPSNHIEEGSIGLQKLYDFGIVSPIYVVFDIDRAKVNGDYLIAILKTEHYRQIFCAATNASVDRRGSLRWKEFSAIHVPLPPLEEQHSIASILANADREIETLQQKLDCLKREKKALMQQLLTGKRRVQIGEVQ